MPWSDQNVENPLVVQKHLIQKKEFPIPENITNENVVEVIRLATFVDPLKRSDMSTIKVILNNINSI